MNQKRAKDTSIEESFFLMMTKDHQKVQSDLYNLVLSFRGKSVQLRAKK